MKIVATYDTISASASRTLPAGFQTAVEYVISLFEKSFTDKTTVNITFSSQFPNSFSAAGSAYFNVSTYDYNTVLSSLKKKATSSDDNIILARLPQSDPLFASVQANYTLTNAQAKNFGLLSSNNNDGYVYLNSASSVPFTYDPAKRAVAGAYDAVGVLVQGISDVLGRFCGFDTNYYKTILGLSRFSSNGNLNTSSSFTDSYFSIDGKTNILQMGQSSGFLGDWGSNVTNDAFGVVRPSVQNDLTLTDVRVMDAVGYTLFNALDYIASYQDLIQNIGLDERAASSHWQNYGYKEGRGVDFNGLQYIASNRDLINAFGIDEQSGARHYIQYSAMINRM